MRRSATITLAFLYIKSFTKYIYQCYCRMWIAVNRYCYTFRDCIVSCAWAWFYGGSRKNVVAGYFLYGYDCSAQWLRRHSTILKPHTATVSPWTSAVVVVSQDASIDQSAITVNQSVTISQSVIKVLSQFIFGSQQHHYIDSQRHHEPKCHYNDRGWCHVPQRNPRLQQRQLDPQFDHGARIRHQPEYKCHPSEWEYSANEAAGRPVRYQPKISRMARLIVSFHHPGCLPNPHSHRHSHQHPQSGGTEQAASQGQIQVRNNTREHEGWVQVRGRYSSLG